MLDALFKVLSIVKWSIEVANIRQASGMTTNMKRKKHCQNAYKVEAGWTHTYAPFWFSWLAEGLIFAQ